MPRRPTSVYCRVFESRVSLWPGGFERKNPQESLTSAPAFRRHCCGFHYFREGLGLPLTFFVKTPLQFDGMEFLKFLNFKPWTTRVVDSDQFYMLPFLFTMKETREN